MTPRRAAHSPTGRPERMARPPRRMLMSMVATVVALMVGITILWAPVRAHSTSAGLISVDPGQSRSIEVAGSRPGRVRFGAVRGSRASARSGWPCSSGPSDPGVGYRTRVRVLPNGAVWAGFSRVVNGQEVLLRSEPTDLRVQHRRDPRRRGPGDRNRPGAAVGAYPGLESAARRSGRKSSPTCPSRESPPPAGPGPGPTCHGPRPPRPACRSRPHP